ncbi:DUF5336 domain-containing protein [Mycobacterium sp. BMJ-28]
MTYPPGSPGYPPAQQGNQYAQTQQFGKFADPAGPSKLPIYLFAAVAVLGLATYAFNFGPLLTIKSSDFPQFGSASGSTIGIGLAVAASVLAGLLAAVGLLPKQKVSAGVVASIALLSFLLVLGEVINAPQGVSIGWALYLVIVSTVLQAGAAIAALLLEAGIITAPEPRPRYEQQPYGQYAQPYYGQQGQPYGAPQAPPQQGQGRPGYPPPSQYGAGYQGQNTGGFSAVPAAGPQGGPPTPPTGFPAFGQPQPAGSSDPTTAVPTQPPAASSQQAGPPPS